MGRVEKFVTLIPKSVTLRGVPGAPLKETVRIIPEKKYPFKIIGHNLSHENNIHYELEQVEHANGTEYVLTVENLKNDAGNYVETISLKTDSNTQPLINIHVRGYIREQQPQKGEQPGS
jgi:hypothetical protein